VPYNLLTYSDVLTPNYIFSQCSITSSVTAPNGTSTAKRITSGATTTDVYFEQGINFSPNTYTWSVFVKQGTATTARILPVHVGIGSDVSLVIFTFATETITSSAIVTSAGFDKLENGWYRIYCSVVITSAVSDLRARYGNPNTPNVYNDWWGAQLVEGTDALPYQPTETRLNRPRVDFSLGGCPSLLVEPQRTNIALWSEQFDSISWIKDVGVSVNANFATSPSGIQNADKVNFASNNLAIYRVGTAVGAHRFSVYLKGEGANIGKQIQLLIGNVGGTTNVTLTDQWVRYETDATSATYAGVGKVGLTQADSVLIWGAQLEAGSYPTSYIPTTSASVTRNADQVYKTGISSLIGQTEGTIYLEADIQKHNESEFYVAISNGFSLGESIYLFQPSGGILQVLFRTGGVDQSISILNANWNIGYNKIAIAYNSTSGEVFMNGVSQGTVALSALPTCSQLTLGARPDISGNLVGSGGYKSSALFKTRLTNDQLEALTGEGFDTYALMASNYNYILQ
jgi:hypothetical protein